VCGASGLGDEGLLGEFCLWSARLAKRRSVSGLKCSRAVDKDRKVAACLGGASGLRLFARRGLVFASPCVCASPRDKVLNPQEANSRLMGVGCQAVTRAMERQLKRVRAVALGDAEGGPCVRAYRGAVIHSLALQKVEMLPQALLVVDHTKGGMIMALVDVADMTEHEVEALALKHGVRELLDMPGRIIMPGFIDTHAHAPQYAFTGTGMDLPLLKW
jgi:hypothetical protein